MNKILIIISCILIMLTIFSCRRNVFNPNIPPRTEFIEDPIANLSIPSKDAAVEVIPVESIYGTGETRLVYNFYHHFFDFNERYYFTAVDQCTYDIAKKDLKITNNQYYHLLEIDVNDNFYMKEIKNRIATIADPNKEIIYRAIVKIINGEAYTNADTIFIQDTDNNYYSSQDIINWTQISQILSDASKKAKTDQRKISIKSQNGKTYTYVYVTGARQFSISRLSDRMKQLAQRLETKFDFKEEDFNNHHMFDLGLNEDGSSNPDFRLNPTNYLNNDTNYVYMGATPYTGTSEMILNQLWLLPVRKNGKDYLIRLPELIGPELYIIDDLISDMNTYKLKSQESLTKALSLVASGGDTSAIQNACYESILNDANYKANKYFLDVITNLGSTSLFSGTLYASANKPITHYVIDIVDIQ
ncbi:hypothetical protein [Brachyspira murdochii]|uniref:Lipoprotein n=1 Tax=Brachyspira murdochii TaxID=84378 RepID=A0ABX5B2Q4_9SPIR|nr:hypothetical protein [Brachyspira murdochii]PPS21114.1 hypothetical protein DJ52_12860 [Brachyspira murdochii]